MPTERDTPPPQGPALSDHGSCPTAHSSDIMASTRDTHHELDHASEPHTSDAVVAASRAAGPSLFYPIVNLPSSTTKDPLADLSAAARDSPTPVSDAGSPSDSAFSRSASHGPTSPEMRYSSETAALQRQQKAALPLYDPFPLVRFRPNTTSSHLKPGARFSGCQTSEKAEYEVVVDVQHVDMEASFMCGYLNIRGLTDEHPSLTTYFEGEMIGSKYGFITKHPEWGANEKVDLHHWAQFPAWRPYQKDAKRGSGNAMMKNWRQKENIWMRWKEYFLVPDHRVKDLTNASFDGFYYICFNQISGQITGTYFHARTDKNQNLNLKPNDQRGMEYGFEFR